MFISIVFVFVLLDLFLSEPDLCRNPKIDSIAWIDDKNMWFFTSGGYYWYLSEKDFPPKEPMGKLPVGFSRGDAIAYRDWFKVCQKSKSNNKPNEQLVLMVEKTSDTNQIIEFDVRALNWSAEPHDWISDTAIGRAKVDDMHSPMEAMFSYRDSEIYVVQGQHYAGIDWKPLCDDPTGYAKDFTPVSTDTLQSSKGAFDAITVCRDVMYQFIGHTFWKASILPGQSVDGKIIISKGNPQDISKDFFTFKTCPELPNPEGNTSSGGGGHSPGNEPTGGDTGDINPTINPEQNTGSSGGNAVLYIVLIVVFLVIVAVIIGLVVFLKSLWNSGTEMQANKGLKSAGAPQSKTNAKPSATPVQTSKKPGVGSVKPIASKK